jgi:hypothetical protein
MLEIEVPPPGGIGDSTGFDDDGVTTTDRTPILLKTNPPFGAPVDFVRLGIIEGTPPIDPQDHGRRLVGHGLQRQAVLAYVLVIGGRASA